MIGHYNNKTQDNIIYKKYIRKNSDMSNTVTNKKSKSLKIFSTNAAGIKSGKADSLVAEVKATCANIVTIQETHSITKGRIKMHPSFVLFESIRAKKHGGTLCAILVDLNPKLISEYNDPFELIVVEIETEDKNVRIITGCGPQENWEEAKRLPFFIALEVEIVKAEMAGIAVITEMDSNSKLGLEYIPNDTHEKSPNGILLANIIERHAPIVANGSTKCSGRITRKRITRNRTEESCIDVMLFSSDMNESFESLLIDEDRKHVLTKIRKPRMEQLLKKVITMYYYQCLTHPIMVIRIRLNLNYTI